MTNKLEILPCPFCNEPGEERAEPGWFACSNNECPAWHMQAEIEDWNKRAAPVVERQEPVAFRYWPKDCPSDKAFTTNHQLPKDFYEVMPLYAEQPAPVAVVLPSREVMRDLIAEVIGGDTYDCTRVWSAWGVGTMSEDDFVPLVEQDERLYELADACLDKVKELNQ